MARYDTQYIRGAVARKNERFESLFRRFKNAVEKADTMQELRKREFFEKPSMRRKRAKKAAIKRYQKQETSRSRTPV